MHDSNVRLPKKGQEHSQILESMRTFSDGDANYRNGKTWSLVYYLGEEHTRFLKDAYGMYFSENGLKPNGVQEPETLRKRSGAHDGFDAAWGRRRGWDDDFRRYRKLPVGGQNLS